MGTESSARLAAFPTIISLPSRTLAFATAHLPTPATPMVGRERELEELRQLLLREEVRLLTLVGPGGVGKTRLAIGVAADLAGNFRDGVVFIPLAGIREAHLALPAMYQALGGREAGSDFSPDRLHQLLDGREALLVLDNFEHLVVEAAAIAGLLAASPRLKILVTSRTALRLSAEHDYMVPPLALPESASPAEADAAEPTDAVQLFVQRAHAALPDFAPSAEEIATIGAICHRLDGLPLAIELAAARINHLSPEALLHRLETPGGARLPLLTGGPRDQPVRHQTMRDTVAWSYELLDERERQVFPRLAVFIDGFSVDAASAVCQGDELETLDSIGALVASSLVRYLGDQNGQPRYGMFETIREFGLEQLAAQGNEAETRDRLADWALALAERAAPRVKAPDAAVWLEALERDHANLRAALSWLVQRQDGPRLARLAAALWPFWEEHAHFAEGRRWLEVALEVGQDAALVDRLNVLCGAGTMARHQADFAQGIALHSAALTIARELGLREEEATILHFLGAQATDLGDFAEARRRLEECLTLAREAGTPRPLIRALHGLAQIQRVELDSEAAIASLEEVLALCREHQMSWLEPYIFNGIALSRAELGEFAPAIAMFRENLEGAEAKRTYGHVVDAIEGLARVAAAMGHAELAARLYGAGEAQRELLTFPISPTELAYAEPVLQRLRQALGEDGFAEAWAAGRTLSRDAAIALAKTVEAESPEDASVSELRNTALCGLTDRELEVLRLLATGYSNREVGDALYISPTTAARHVANIFNKLGVDSRAKASAFAHRHGLLFTP